MSIRKGLNAMEKYNRFQDLLKRSKLFCDTYSPGDGITRYRFFSTSRDYFRDYFSADGLYTALGRKEAITFLDGVVTGRWFGMQDALQDAALNAKALLETEG